MEQSPAASGRGRSRGRGRGQNTLQQQCPSPPGAREAPIIETNTTTTTSETINNQLAERFATSTTISPTASQLTTAIRRLQKPKELGTIGTNIEVFVTYFPVLQFPQDGFIYRYYVQIENKSGRVIRRNHRRIIYHCWLDEFCQKNPQIQREKIVFDNQTAIYTYGQQLPDIDERGMTQKLMGKGQSHRYGEYQFSVRQVGNPIDLALLRTLRSFYTTNNGSNSNTNDIDYIQQILAIVLHEHCSSQADYISNRTYFKQPVPTDNYGQWDLGLGKAAWRGFYSCLVFANGAHQLLINLDVNHGTFQKKQPFLDFLCEVMRHSPCGQRRYGRNSRCQKAEMSHVLEFLDPDINYKCYDREMEFLLKHCKHLRVRLQTSNRIIMYEICGLGLAASSQTFKWKEKNNRLITVADYYVERYHRQLKYPTLPVLKMRNDFVMSMEVLDVEPVKVRKISDSQRALLSRCSKLNPSDYYRSIKDIRNKFGQECLGETSVATAWNIEIDTNMQKVSARVLPAPNTIYRSKNQVDCQQYSSRRDVRNNTNTPLYQPINFPSVWAMINLSSSVDAVSCETFSNELSEAAANQGIRCPPPLIYEEYNLRNCSIEKMIDAVKAMMENNTDCKFFIVILPEDDSIKERAYGELKKLCELESGFGIVTQMINAKTITLRRESVRQCQDSAMTNILLKINAKLNGINSRLDIPEVIKKFFTHGRRIMYVGVDLCHAPSGSDDQRSIVTVVGSADDIPDRYFKEIYIQNRSSSSNRKDRIEHVVKLKEIMKSLIGQYWQYRGYPPNAIVIYRDGIADSVFDTIFQTELTSVREACIELRTDYQPYLTYIVVNKRHHTKYLPTDLRTNIQAGTVIDSHDVTNPTTYSFFLKSHNFEMGTGRPILYHVLYDDNELKSDEVQMLTYALCFMYARSLRSISVPAPVKYADLLAQRAKFYLPAKESSQTSHTNETANVEPNDGNIRIRLNSKLASDALYFL